MWKFQGDKKLTEKMDFFVDPGLVCGDPKSKAK
jgi:hypothetical protein